MNEIWKWLYVYPTASVNTGGLTLGAIIHELNKILFITISKWIHWSSTKHLFGFNTSNGTD